ncbi:hypothetical protein AXG93_4776s1480 [Marchantia polymorpha subsp. ruderalis]|uniref:Uncharacterized protein n=1 Tax=Marchantia polymorpha subsp. ruderalis TaxID=1480154 RepID=A0A176VTN0_MARPO|nr:hypothetical protein AXG93_4776s1480 [Marchantia polymorpha subsp. ruderalis]
MKTKTILLTILDVKCGGGVGVRVGTDLFEYLKRMGRDVVTRILNVTSDNALKLIRQPTEQLRDGLVKMCHSKVIRQQYRIEAFRSGLSSTEPTHVDLPTRWNSTHQMCDNAFRKHVVIDTIMDQYKDDIGHGALKDSEWQKLVQELAIIAAYLNPQIPKPTDTSELMVVTEIVRNPLQRRYSDEITRIQSRELP